jgi:hypothetical protein
MQWLTLVPEDSGVQRLKADNRRPAVTRSVDPVSASAPLPSTRGDEQVQMPRQPATDRRRGERRGGYDRRVEQQPVLLDTRCSHDRRDGENRRQAPGNRTQCPPAGTRINLYA